ncbi:hypothetical protein ISN45_Aa01g023760 [Arabidopsis thaliana x Arabidopsis arenosa]|uniref:Transmembrane protein n=1 Tax=Arabidopsis thaliana x Arabidopsis arenosa TaxID=1240361 RepID=A0A8T2C2T1_9BRAS|nr:hypothetical protein ISN45_Aa01g023760 [Arabidopsis thaliana x Arabidopsis arenosa]
MFLFLLLLLVFPHIDNVLGARMELRELGETNHADQVTVQKPIKIPPGLFKPRPVTVPRVPPYRPKRCRHCRPRPPPKAFPRNTPSH